MGERALVQPNHKADERVPSSARKHGHPSGATSTPLTQHRLRLSLPKVLTVVADAAAIAAAMILAFELWALISDSQVHANLSSHVLVGASSVPMWTAIFARYRLYAARRISSRVREFEQVLHALAVSVFATAGLSFLLHLTISRGWLLLSFVFAVVVVQAERELVRWVFAVLRRSGRLLRRIVVIGTNLEALNLCATLQRNRSLGYDVVGMVGDADPHLPLLEDIPIFGKIDELSRVLEQTGVAGVLIATTAVDCDTSNRLARELTDAGIHVELSSSLRDIRAERLTVRSLGGFPVVYVEPIRRGGWRALGKRSFDILIATSGLLALAPLLVIVAILVKLDSPGPLLFRQDRVGKDGRLFRVLKFRTMVPDAERLLQDLWQLNEADGPLFKIRNDPRVTRIGRVLRASSLDELPQLWNVLRDQMSVVGPRPALPSEVQTWTPQLYQRLRVKPGLTGMWQVNGRIDVSFEEYMRLDLYYVDNWSLWMDLAIVVKTFPTLLFRKGGY